jgi:type II secretory pathway component PulF
MPLFTYVAFNKKGKEEKGIVDANNIQAARTKLKNKGLYVRSIAEDREKEERDLFPFFDKTSVSNSEKRSGPILQNVRNSSWCRYSTGSMFNVHH